MLKRQLKWYEQTKSHSVSVDDESNIKVECKSRLKTNSNFSGINTDQGYNDELMTISDNLAKSCLTNNSKSSIEVNVNSFPGLKAEISSIREFNG